MLCIPGTGSLHPLENSPCLTAAAIYGVEQCQAQIWMASASRNSSLEPLGFVLAGFLVIPPPLFFSCNLKAGLARISKQNSFTPFLQNLHPRI